MRSLLIAMAGHAAVFEAVLYTLWAWRRKLMDMA
jgi:hypothetical protein